MRDWGECWPPPVFMRFAGEPPPACSPGEGIVYAPSGYAQSIAGTSVASPIPITQMQQQPLFTRDTALPPGTLSIRFQYIPAYAPSGIVGGGLFGGGAIGHRVPYHGALIPQQIGGFTVYEPAPGGDQRK